MEHSKLMGMQVTTSSDEQIGTVTDVVTDESSGQPEYLIVSMQEATGSESTVIPYSAAKSNMQGNKIVMEKSRLQNAPTLKQGEWRSSDAQWRSEADTYWSREIRQAEAPGAREDRSTSSDRSSGSSTSPDTSSSSSSQESTTSPQSDTSDSASSTSSSSDTSGRYPSSSDTESPSSSESPGSTTSGSGTPPEGTSTPR